jgi:hypothetical protein
VHVPPYFPVRPRLRVRGDAPHLLRLLVHQGSDLRGDGQIVFAETAAAAQRVTQLARQLRLDLPALQLRVFYQIVAAARQRTHCLPQDLNALLQQRCFLLVA